jgi:hypothetical protein
MSKRHDGVEQYKAQNKVDKQAFVKYKSPTVTNIHFGSFTKNTTKF